jgi:hypothetical protein
MRKIKMMMAAGLMAMASSHAALPGFSGKPYFQGTLKELYYSKTGQCSYLAFDAVNAADNVSIRVAIPISGGAWVGTGFTTEGDANRYWALLLTAKSSGSQLRIKLMDDATNKWNRCGDGADYYLPEYILLP